MSYRESDRRRWQRERFRRRERAARARIKDLAAHLQQWLDEPEGDVIWEDLGDDHKGSSWAGRGRLYRDRDRGRLGGVCAGLAQYYRMRLWKVRAIALVAVFIIPTVMVIAYVLALIFLPNAPAYQQSSYFERSARTNKKRARRDTYGAGADTFTDASRSEGREGLAPSQASVKRTKTKFQDLEARLQEMEAYVTSRRFKTDRAFRDLESS